MMIFLYNSKRPCLGTDKPANNNRKGNVNLGLPFFKLKFYFILEIRILIVPAFIKQLIEKLVFGRFSRVLIFDSSRVWNVILFFWKQASSMKGEVQLEPSGERNPRDSDPLLENQADSSTGSSSEINSEDIEAGSVPCCRICLECDGEPGEHC